MSSESNVLEYLEQSAGVLGDKVAFSDENSQVTYEQLYDLTKRIGTGLAAAIGKTGEPVGVIIERNIESLCCFLGVVASGNFYVPIDAGLPPDRLDSIILQMQPACIVAIGNNASESLTAATHIDIVEYEKLIETEPDANLLAEIRASSLDTDPLYAICTSGSTGVPKGVLVSHRSVLDFIPVFAETFSFDQNECFGNQAPFDFDVSVKDIYTTLYCGATMHVIPKVCFVMPKRLPGILDERGITTIVWAVSAMCVVSGFDAFKYLVPGKLRKVLFSGEAMPVKQLNIWRKYFPEALFVNLYGPTEITCNCMYYIIDREFDDDERLPLGVPFANERVVVLDDDGQPVCEGQTGELCVMGTCLALGYYRDFERTADAFVQNPLNNRYPELMYRTGDLARIENGMVYFAGRSDFQIKHMGHRIELEEIELHLNAVDGIERSCCLFDEARNKIVAFYSGTCDSSEIAKALLRKLPKYMLPNIYYRLDALPITKNGKIDRRLLASEHANRERRPS